MTGDLLNRAISLSVLMPMMLVAQAPRAHDPVPLRNWPGPLYWQPNRAEQEASHGPLSTVTPRAEAANLPLGTAALVFVAMTPCRVVDTRAGMGFPGSFGPPSIAGGLPVRTIPIQSSTTCSIPSVARAYSFNVTVVPPGPLFYITLYPATADPQPAPPNVSTLNSLQGYILANAAIVPAGTDGQGSVDVFASDPTELIIDINGYYAAPGDPNGNFALGFGALASNTTGTFNTAEGVQALQLNTTGGGNTATGATALEKNTTGMFNTATGGGALHNNTTGNQNTATGVDALSSNTTGGANTAVGYQALADNTTASNNTATGTNALQSNSTGDGNTAVGSNTLPTNSTGFNNTAVGYAALFFNSIGTNNTAVGGSALQFNVSNGNTAVGGGALGSNTAGFQNTAVGLSALKNNTTGLTNVAIGVGAATNAPAGSSNNIHIGSFGAAGDSATIRIGNVVCSAAPPGVFCQPQTSFFAAGIRGATTGSNDAIPVVIDSNGQLGTVNSSRRFKEDIHDMGDASNGLLSLHPVTFRYRQPFADGSKPLQYGLIAEEVEQVYPDLVAHSADGQIESVKYQVLDAMLLNELQKQGEANRRQGEEIRVLEERLAALEALLPKAAVAVPEHP